MEMAAALPKVVTVLLEQEGREQEKHAMLFRITEASTFLLFGKRSSLEVSIFIILLQRNPYNTKSTQWREFCHPARSDHSANVYGLWANHTVSSPLGVPEEKQVCVLVGGEAGLNERCCQGWFPSISIPILPINASCPIFLLDIAWQNHLFLDYTYIHVHIHKHTYVHLQKHMHTNIHIDKHTNFYTHIHTCTNTHTQMHIRTNTHKHKVYTHTYKHMCTWTHTCACTHIQIHTAYQK